MFDTGTYKRYIPGFRKVYVGDADPISEGLQAGLFAAKRIVRGELIFHAKGTRVKMEILSKADSEMYPRAICVGNNTWINPSKKNPLYYLNHSCEPNAGIKGQRSITALRTIEPGEHITIDYSITETDELWKMPCVCGEASCRGVVRAITDLPKKTFKRYLPYVPKHQRHHYESQVK